MDNNIQQLRDWLVRTKDRYLKVQQEVDDVTEKVNNGAKAKAIKDTIYYIDTHFLNQTTNG